MKGFSLLEVLIALLLLSIAMLNFMQQKIKMKTSLQQTYFRQVALEQTLSIADRLQVNRDIPYRLHEITEWNFENAELLPQGIGNIRYCNGGGDVSVCWQARFEKCVTLHLSF